MLVALFLGNVALSLTVGVVAYEWRAGRDKSSSRIVVPYLPVEKALRQHPSNVRRIDSAPRRLG